MSNLNDHLRRTFIAGLFTVVPIGITVFFILKFDELTRGISNRLFGASLPLVGVLIAILVIYAGGLLATSLVGRYLLGLIDRLLGRVPVLRDLYLAWKQVAFVPTGTEGTFSRVVLVIDEVSHLHMLGFCSGVAIDGDPDIFCVFIPAAPNPISGSRLFFVPRNRLRFLDVTTEQAFKLILSNGNYIPPAVGEAAGAAERSLSYTEPASA